MDSKAHRHRSATRRAAPARTITRGEPVDLGILASVLHCVGNAEKEEGSGRGKAGSGGEGRADLAS